MLKQATVIDGIKIDEDLYPCSAQPNAQADADDTDRQSVTFQVLSTKVAVRTVCAISWPSFSIKLAMAMASSNTPPIKHGLSLRSMR